MNPIVSILMPVFNSEKFVEASILSVVTQTYKNWELWLVNDGSTDKSEVILKMYEELYDNIYLISSKNNMGSAYSRNAGLEKAKGKYIAFLDADDLWKPNKLEVQIKKMESEKLFFTYTSYDLITEQNQFRNKTIQCPSIVTYKRLLRSNEIGCLTVVYNAEVLGKVEMPHLKKRQDYATWLNILKTGINGIGIQECLASYRIVSNSLSSNGFNVVKYNWKVLSLQTEINVFYKLYYFVIFLCSKFFKYFKIRF